MAHRLGLCEYTTDRDWWNELELAPDGVPNGARNLDVAPRGTQLVRAHVSRQDNCACRKSGRVLVATRPNVAQAIVATTAANVFMASVPGLEHAGVEHAGLEYARLEYACL